MPVSKASTTRCAPRSFRRRTRGRLLDLIEHAVNDAGGCWLELLDPPRRERRHQQTADAGVLSGIHLGDELRVHDLVVLAPSPGRAASRSGGVGAENTLWTSA